MKFIYSSFCLLIFLISILSQVALADGIDMRLGKSVEIATEMLPYGYIGDDYSTKIIVTGGSGDYILKAKSLPSGLALKESGLLEGRIRVSR